MRTVNDRYIPLYDETAEINDIIMEKGSAYQMKEIRSGRMLECEFSKRWYTAAEFRDAKKHLTPERQRRHNEKTARQRIQRKAEANFDERDMEVTLTYGGNAPTLQQAQKDIRNYIRRIKAYRKKRGLPELRYLYAIEYSDEEGDPKRIHHHILLSGDMDRDAAEGLWGKGRANSVRLQPDENGLFGIATYMAKAKRDVKYKKRWGCSRNLEEPKIRRAMSLPGRSRLTGRRIEKIAEDAKRIMEQAYPDYIFITSELKRSEYIPGAYLYVRMRRKE